MKKRKKRAGKLIFLGILAMAAVVLWKQKGFFEHPVETMIQTVNAARDGMRAVTETVDEEEVRGKFCYEQLTDDGKRVYRDLLHGIRRQDANIFIHSGDGDLISDVLDAVLADNPELFWMDGSGEILSHEVFSFYAPQYNCTSEERERKQEEIDRAAEACLGGLAEGASEYDKLKYIYDYLINTTDYDQEAADSQNIYSALVNHRSVCAGYAKSLQFLLQQIGMECIYVTGTTSGQRAHAWNIVRCEGEYYQVDATWGDPVFMESEGEEIPPSLKIDYDYLCCTDEEILKSHTPDTRYSYPACTATDCNYYRRNGLYYDAYDEQVFLQAMNDSISEGQSQTVFKFADEELYQAASQVILESLVSQAAANLARTYGLHTVRYSYIVNEQTYKVVILWNYE